MTNKRVKTLILVSIPILLFLFSLIGLTGSLIGSDRGAQNSWDSVTFEGDVNPDPNNAARNGIPEIEGNITADGFPPLPVEAYGLLGRGLDVEEMDTRGMQPFAFEIGEASAFGRDSWWIDGFSLEGVSSEDNAMRPGALFGFSRGHGPLLITGTGNISTTPPGISGSGSVESGSQGSGRLEGVPSDPAPYEVALGDFPNDGTQEPESAPVPEPATMLLLGSGLVGVAAFRRRLGGSKRNS